MKLTTKWNKVYEDDFQTRIQASEYMEYHSGQMIIFPPWTHYVEFDQAVVEYFTILLEGIEWDHVVIETKRRLRPGYTDVHFNKVKVRTEQGFLELENDHFNTSRLIFKILKRTRAEHTEIYINRYGDVDITEL